ncbi:MAG: DNA repair protein RadC [Planctomycetota bacterium]
METQNHLAREAGDPLAVLLGGPRPAAALRARSLLARSDLVELSRLAPYELASRFALSDQAAARVSAAFSLGRRVERARQPARPPMRTPKRVYAAVAAELRGLQRERFLALLLDGKHRLKRIDRVSEGTLTSSLVHPREVFRAAVREAAAAVVVAHNHPSGDPEPSREDLEVTRRLADAGRLLGIPLLDHVVVGQGCFVSLRDRLDLGGRRAGR